MITFCINPIPVVTPLGDGYAVYIKSNGQFEDDEWAVALVKDGQVRHFISSDIKIFHNKTYNINKDEKNTLQHYFESRTYGGNEPKAGSKG